MAGVRGGFIEVKVNAAGLATSPLTGGAGIDKRVLGALTVGTGTGQFNRAYAVSGSISGAGSTNIDLNGSVTDINGDSLTLDKVVGFLLVNTTAVGGGHLTLTDKSANGVTVGATSFIGVTQDLVVVPAGGFVAWYSPVGFASAATADAITLAAPGAAVTYELYVLGIDS